MKKDARKRGRVLRIYVPTFVETETKKIFPPFLSVVEKYVKKSCVNCRKGKVRLIVFI